MTSPPATDTAANRRRLRQSVRDIALLWAVAGVIALLFAGVRLLRTNAMSDWPTVPGVVTASGIETVAIAGRAIRYEPAVRIVTTYAVDGQSTTTTAVSRETTPVLAGLAEADRLLAAYPAGAAVTVTYNPTDPTEAYLETAVPDGLFTPGLLLLGAAAVIGLVALLLRD